MTIAAKRVSLSFAGSILATSQAFAQTTGRAGSPLAGEEPDVDSGLTTAAIIGIPIILLILVALLQPWGWFKGPKKLRRRSVKTPAPEAETPASPQERRPYFLQPSQPQDKLES